LTSVNLSGGQTLDAAQEDWDGGVTVFLPTPLASGETFTLVMNLEGNFLERPDDDTECFYPRATTDWYPQHGYLDRSNFDLVFHYRKSQRAVSVGTLVREEADPADRDLKVSEWRTDVPIPIATFAVGNFETYTDVPKVGDVKVPVVLYSPKGQVKSDFVVAEMGNSLRFFSALFGPYEYKSLEAAYFPKGFGQGLPTLLLLPKADWAVGRTFQFIAHETSHQWWGDMVTWRSYRDQWLSEGFADYSGLLYTQKREGVDPVRDMMKSFHFDLITPAVGERGMGKGPVADIGPLILGHRLSSRASYNGYTTLIYKKGALVLRMLHFLFTDPQTGNGQPFFDMMSDFVRAHRDGWASTEDFIRVANSHFSSTPIAKKYHMTDLNWFFREWVYQAHLPTYRLEYRLEPQANGSSVLRGTVYQDNAPNDWAMPLPLLVHFGKDKTARGTILAYGPQQNFAITLPAQPSDVELDPESWVLSEKTSEKSIK
jgi:aminopeptidase N